MSGNALSARENKTEAVPFPCQEEAKFTFIDLAHKERHESKGNGFGYAIIPDDGVANAIVVGGMGKERNLVIDKRLTDFTPLTRIKGEVNREGWRRMTPRNGRDCRASLTISLSELRTLPLTSSLETLSPCLPPKRRQKKLSKE